MTDQKTKVLIVGLGGVGILAAYALSLKPEVELSTIIRSDYNVATTRGFNIESVDYGTVNSFKPQHIYRSVNEAKEDHQEFDFVVVATKNTPDVHDTFAPYAEAVTEGKTTIVLIQNGLGIEKAVIKKFPKNIVLSGVSMISSTNFNGDVEHVVSDELGIGYFQNPNLPEDVQLNKAKNFVALYNNGKNRCYLDEDVQYARWRKLIYNASFNTIGAITDLDAGRVQEFGGTDTLIIPIMKEIIAIAKSEGVELSEDLMDVMIKSDDGEWYAPSMLVDVRKGNQIELEIIVGNALQVAKENNVSTPVLTTVYQLLKLLQWRLKEQNGLVVMPEKRPIPTRNLTKQ